jgi:hypothetical protein
LLLKPRLRQTRLEPRERQQKLESHDLPVNRRSVIAGKRPGLSLASARAACIKACQD